MMGAKQVTVHQPVLAGQARQAAELRTAFTRRGTLVVHLVSSPGAGKTSLLEATARYWGTSHRAAVLVGDLATERDAERLAKYMPTRQLTTGGACHLELPLVLHGLEMLPAEDYDFLFIENVGNLVCPASFDLGEHVRVVVLATTEGDDKPGKYPKIFRTSQTLVINKTDLLPYVPFSAAAATVDARRVQPELRVLSVSALTGEGIPAWCAYLEEQRTELLRSRDAD
jgi:hydrogenase nickel incorporation protein HypB